MAAVMAMAQPSQHTQGSATLLNALLSSFGLAAAAQSAIAKVSRPCCAGIMSCLHSFGACVIKRQSWWLSPGPTMLEVLLVCLAVSLAASALKCKGHCAADRGSDRHCSDCVAYLYQAAMQPEWSPASPEIVYAAMFES